MLGNYRVALQLVASRVVLSSIELVIIILLLLLLLLLMTLKPFSLDLDSFFSFLILYTVGRAPLDERSARRKASTYTQDNTNRINANTDIHASSGIRAHDLSV
jgi:hypothetical protein